MLRGLWNAATGMKAQQQKLDVTADNIANVNTGGFKKKDTVFQDLVYQAIERKGNAVVSAREGERKVSVGTGSRLGAIRTDMRAGTYLQTDGKFDLTIVGDGFFRVILPDGREGYTRDGNFRLDEQGNLVTAAGYRVLFPELPAGVSEFDLSSEGVVQITMDDDEPVDVGRVELAAFNNTQGLEKIGDNLLLATAASGEARYFAPGENVKVLQGYLEGSNVDLSEEMVRMLVSQRAFELNSRSLRTADEMWSIANQMRR